MIKAVLLFLLVMVGIGMVSNLLFPGSLRRKLGRSLPSRKPGTCPSCGRYLIGAGPCDCKKGR